MIETVLSYCSRRSYKSKVAGLSPPQQFSSMDLRHTRSWLLYSEYWRNIALVVHHPTVSDPMRSHRCSKGLLQHQFD
jgi:hypothetical protein